MHDRSRGTTQFDTPDFRAQLDAVLDAPLTPEVINDYADIALTGLIGIIDEAKTAYTLLPTIAEATEQGSEDAAARYFGLHEVGATLIHISRLAEEIDAIDARIDQAKRVDKVFLPPDRITTSPPEPDGTTSEAPPQEIPRLKTVLFLLAKEFDIDIDDERQLVLDKGIITDGMRRAVSYATLVVPPLERLILVNDEEGNATFTFDLQAMRRLGMTPATLTDLTKSGLNQLIEEHDGLGIRVIYSDYFTTHMLSALKAERLSSQAVLSGSSGQAQEVRYLRTDALPKDAVSLTAFAKSLDVDKKALEAKIAELRAQDETFAQSVIYRSRRGSTYLSVEQQAYVQAKLTELGWLVERAPEGYLSTTAFAKATNSAVATVSRMIERLADELGVVQQYRFAGWRTIGLSPDQQRILTAQMVAEGRDPAVGPPPDGIKSIAGIAKDLGFNHILVDRTVRALGEELGPVRQYRFVGYVTAGFTPEQQRLIGENIKTLGWLIDDVPEGIRTVTALAKELDIEPPAVKAAVNELGDQLGELRTYKFHRGSSAGLDARQQQIIREHLTRNGALCERAPEGVLSVGDMVRALGAPHHRITRIVAMTEDEIGPRKIYRFRSGAKEGFTPAQQEIIARCLGQGAETA